MSDNIVTYDEFSRLELLVGSVTGAERVDGSEKLIRLEVFVGHEHGHRQIVAGIGTAYAPENLLDTQIVIVANLKPRVLMGLESQGMLLAAHSEEGEPILIRPDRTAPHGSTIS